MPRRFTTEDVRAAFESYGYAVPSDFVYMNNHQKIEVTDTRTGDKIQMTYKQLQYRINKGQIQQIADYELPHSEVHKEVKRNTKRLDTNDTKALFEKYGYSVRPDYVHKNNTTKVWVHDEQLDEDVFMNYKQLKYRIDRGRSEYEIDPFRRLMEAISIEEDPHYKKLNNVERYEKRFGEEFKNYDYEFKKDVMELSKELLKKLLLRRPFTFAIGDDPYSKLYEKRLYALSHAMKFAAPKINMDIAMTIHNNNGTVQYARLNENTINLLDTILEYNDDADISDSNNVIIDTFCDVNRIDFEFREFAKGKRHVGAFFPYYNLSDIDLTGYGIYRKNEVVNESCLLTAFKTSGILSDDQLSLLRTQLRTKLVPKEELKYISELFKIHINCKIHYANSKSSHTDYGEEYKPKTIKLHIIEDHYILDKDVMSTPFYVKNYDKINANEWFKNHERKKMLKKWNFKNDRERKHEFAKNGCSIKLFIDTMIESGLLEPMSDKDKHRLKYEPDIDPQYIPKIPISCTQSSRKLVVKNKHNYPGRNKLLSPKTLFGYDVSQQDLPKRYNELQKLVDSLNLRSNIDVKLYYRFGDLMQKIMYEYGCFDDVYELTGDVSDKIRSELRFPKVIWNEGLYEGKLYYIDQAGAYMSSVTSIPTGIPDENGVFKGVNTKIKELIQKLYVFRMRAKKFNNNGLATTIKFLMNSSWGYSMKKPRYIQKKYFKDLDNYLETYGPYIAKYEYTKGKSGYVYKVNPYVQHYSYPQFARSVLNNFNNKMSELGNIVNILYSKVDSALITEDDYNKLVDMGYISEITLGKFKVEHIFTKMYVKSAEKWIGMNEDGTYFYHLPQKLKNICMNSDDPIETLMKA